MSIYVVKAGYRRVGGVGHNIATAILILIKM